MDPITSTLAGVGLIGGGLSAFSGYKSNERNIELQRETNAKNEQMMREGWARDDQAVWRRVQDLNAAGLSPTLAAGSAAASSSPIKIDSPNSQDWGSAAIGSGVQGVLAASNAARTHIDVQKTAAEVGKVNAETSNIEQTTAATEQNMKIQNIMTAFQTKAIDAQTMKTRIEAAKADYEKKIAEIDAGKAQVTGVTPSSSGTAKNVSDATNFGKKFLEKLNPYANQQELMQEYYEKMQKMKGGKK